MPISVFVVEDSPVVQECLMGLVEDVEGCVLAGVADNEPEALQKISAQQPDVLILDLYINAGTGFAVLKRTKEAFPRIRVLVLTNLNGPAMVEKCREYGADNFFDKTIDLDRLEAVLRDMVRENSATVPGGPKAMS